MRSARPVPSRSIAARLLSPFSLASRALLLATVVLLVQSLFWTRRVPILFKLGVAALALVAAVRPGDALFVVAGLLPFTHVLTTRIWRVHPVALAEALVLTFFAGYLIWRWPRSARLARLGSLERAASVFALVVLASCIVQLAVLTAWHDYPLAYLRRFVLYLAQDYLTTVPDVRPWVEGQGFATTAALLIEGAALLIIVGRLCRADAMLGGRVLAAVALAGAGAGLLNVIDVGHRVLRGEAPFRAVLLGDHRSTAFVPSLNSSGAYFLLVAAIALGATFRVPRPVRALTAAPAMLALWLTKTYSAIVAGLAAAAAIVAWRIGGLRGRASLRRALWGAAAAGAGVGLGLILVNPLGLLPSRAYLSLYLRRLFAETAVRMWAANPWFGAGLAQYGLRFREFSSPELLSYYDRADAHNYFLWVTAELGIVGGVAFFWLLGTALARSWNRLRANPQDTAFVTVLAGVIGFLLTWLGGQPLTVPLIAYTFWIVLGVSTSSTPASAPPPGDGTSTDRWRRPGQLAIAAFVMVVLGSVPFRIHQAVGEVDFARVTYGFAGWEMEADGTPYRWTGPRATFFVPAAVSAVEVPVRAFPPAELGFDAFEVRIFVDRRLASAIRLGDDGWHTVRVPAPPPSRRGRFWRVDLRVRPWWRPADKLPDSSDRRRLGVKVGEIVSLRP